MVTCRDGGLVNDVLELVLPADARQHAVSVDQQRSTADRNPATGAITHVAFYTEKYASRSNGISKLAFAVSGANLCGTNCQLAYRPTSPASEDFPVPSVIVGPILIWHFTYDTSSDLVQENKLVRA